MTTTFKSSIRKNNTFPSQVYINKILEKFTDHVIEARGGEVSYIEFGKQDMRSVISITPYNNSCQALGQTHFNTTNELLSFVEGFLKAKEGSL